MKSKHFLFHFLFVLLSLLTFTAFAQQKQVEPGYIDLGLSSGTIWKKVNVVGLFTYDDALNQFGTRLPTSEQWEELVSECDWTWTGNGYKVTGPNGNSIILPAAGGRYCDGSMDNSGSFGHYWSSTPFPAYDEAYFLEFVSEGVSMNIGSLCRGRAVRLVQDK